MKGKQPSTTQASPTTFLFPNIQFSKNRSSFKLVRWPSNSNPCLKCQPVETRTKVTVSLDNSGAKHIAASGEPPSFRRYIGLGAGFCQQIILKYFLFFWAQISLKKPIPQKRAIVKKQVVYSYVLFYRAILNNNNNLQGGKLCCTAPQ